MSTRVKKTPLFKKSLHDLIRGIRGCKDPAATDKYIRDAISECRQEVLSQDMDVKTMAVLKLAYLQMLGYDMSWASFNVLEVMSSPKFAQKRVGYLAAMQSFGVDTDVLMLATNMLKKDLASSNHLDVAMAISGLSNIVSPSLARDLAEDLIKMMNHSKPYVRKKAVMVMYKIFLQFPEALRTSFPRLRDKLEDPEISVVSATVNVICELAKKHPKNYLPLAPQLFNILTTSSNNWMLIKIIKLFASLAPIEPRLKAKLIPPITNIIQTTTAMSLLYECINCIVSGGMLSKDDEQLATMCVGKLRIFFEETDQNLKFVGLLAYNKIVLTHPLLVAQNADVIMDCMDDPDLSIRERAVELVVYLVNTDTLFEVVKRLMLQLIPQSRDQVLPEHYRTEVVRRILDMCSNNTYANVTNFEWYVAVLVDLVKITEGVKDIGAEIGMELQNVAVRVRSVRDYAVGASVRMVTDKDIMIKNPGVLKYAGWIVGEYAIYLDNPEFILDAIVNIDRQTLSDDIKAVYIQAIPKIYCQYAGSDRIPWTHSRTQEMFQLTENIVSYLEKYSTSMDIEVQERSVEFLEMFRLIALAINERPTDDSDLTSPALVSQAMPSMFNFWELNPVSAKAQKRIPIPEGLDLDEEFNVPVVYSESEDEEEALLREQIMKQQELNSSKNINAASPSVTVKTKSKSKSSREAAPSESEDEEEMERRRHERRRRQAEDPYYILESDKVASKSRKPRRDSESSESSGPEDPMKNEKLDIDSIPIMKLEIASIAAPVTKKKSKRHRTQLAHVEIAKEETFGDEHDASGDPEEIAQRRSSARAASHRAKNILRVDARGLENYDLDSADEDEADRQEVEKFKAEILEARKNAAKAAEEEVKATHIVVKKKKRKAKLVKKVKKGKEKSDDKASQKPAEEDNEKNDDKSQEKVEEKVEENAEEMIDGKEE
ncbi:adaptin N terminal region-domain-containing protein [Lipomyces tetrasporus]|uniref:AP-3 complex subunit delta n=1 Tax=Lipomyces tetrasporus TaxID=54092 RepID=A0AAD7VR49_9ASCO|nr:adaptin N terminal region-domain-containing protein [Lipomyces tetrasporus]KAJ8098858.1 adaptin N terminal region-domain-containing protein [Lipomyces tetrasporus]